MLFDLSADIGESKNVAGANPEIVKKLRGRMLKLDREITENARAPWMKNQ